MKRSCRRPTPALFGEVSSVRMASLCGCSGLQLVSVAHQKIQGKFGISGIILGAAGFEGFAILGQGRRVDGKEH